jgi:hypothetical protein
MTACAPPEPGSSLDMDAADAAELMDKQNARERCAQQRSGQMVLECGEGEIITDIVVERAAQADSSCSPISVYSCSYNTPKAQELYRACTDRQRCSVPVGSAQASCGSHESVVPDGRGGAGGASHAHNRPLASALRVHYRCEGSEEPPLDPDACVSAEALLSSLPRSEFSPGLTSGNKGQTLCLLCENGLSGLKRPNYVADALGNTCAQLTLQASIDANKGKLDDAGCVAKQQAYNSLCCGQEPAGGLPDICQLPPPPPPEPRPPSGPYQPCSVCRNGQTPKNASMVITMLYVGSATCTQMDRYAKDGQIATHLCAPLQYFAEEPCGCN